MRTSVKLASHMKDGNDVLLEMLQPGEFFGYPAATGRDVYNEATQTQTSACILSIRGAGFRAIMKGHAAIAISVMDITTHRLNASRQRIQHLSSLPVKSGFFIILVNRGHSFSEKHPY